MAVEVKEGGENDDADELIDTQEQHREKERLFRIFFFYFSGLFRLCGLALYDQSSQRCPP